VGATLCIGCVSLVCWHAVHFEPHKVAYGWAQHFALIVFPLFVGVWCISNRTRWHKAGGNMWRKDWTQQSAQLPMGQLSIRLDTWQVNNTV
jgi:hypothetical protein